MKKTTFYTDDSHWINVESKMIKDIYKILATGRLCKKSVAQLIHHSTFNISFERALEVAFLIYPSKDLTAEELNSAKKCYSIGENRYIERLMKRVLHDEKYHNNLKAVAELKKYVTQANPNAPLPGLTFNLSTDGKNPPKKKGEQHNSKPLDLTATQH